MASSDRLVALRFPFFPAGLTSVETGIPPPEDPHRESEGAEPAPEPLGLLVPPWADPPDRTGAYPLPVVARLVPGRAILAELLLGALSGLTTAPGSSIGSTWWVRRYVSSRGRIPSTGSAMVSRWAKQ